MNNESVSFCQFPGCVKPTESKRRRGLCRGHRTQEDRGQPLRPLLKRRPSGTPPVIEYDESPCPRPDLKGPCHIFRGGKRDGYGQVYLNGKIVSVHVYVWSLVKGSPVDEGMEVDHQCRVRPCCNVDHLREVTHQVNCTENIVGHMGQVHREKTHCPQGHPYDENNTYILPRSGSRLCRECRRVRNRNTIRKRENGRRCVITKTQSSQ